ALRLSAVEGQPQGLVLRIVLPDTAEISLQSLELYRVESAGEPVLLQALPMDDTLRADLADGVELVDGALRVGASYAYQVLGIVNDDVASASEVLEVVWDPPAVPENVTATARLPGAVELDWD